MQYFVPDLLFWKAAARCVEGPRQIRAMQIAAVPGIPVKLSEPPDRVFDRSPSRYLLRRGLRAGFVCERFHSLEKFARCVVRPSFALVQSYERRETIPQAPLRLLIGEARKSSKVPPIGARWITSEATCQFLRGLGAESEIGEYSSVVHPCLKVAGRSLYNEGWLKPANRHPRDRFSAEITDQAQRMSVVRADEYVCTARILPPEPAKCGVDLLDAPAGAEQHPSVLMKNANSE